MPEILANEEGFQHNHQVLSIARTLNQLDRLRDYQASPTVSETSPTFIKEKSVRSLYDWRATLIFLSSICIEGEPPREKLILEKLDQSVMDRFNTHITDGRKPNLAHSMLAHLARPLRFRTILSTNFDKLLEDAFSEIHHNLYKFRVSVTGVLPDARAVRSLDSIVKLHGEMAETRADFSLDEVPTPADVATFQAYIRPRAATEYTSVENHVLVAGVSGRDNRIVQFMKRSLDHIDDLKVFWICYNDNDVVRISNVFENYIDKDHLKSRIVVTKTPRLDLLLYELYQKCTLSLPPGGFSFTFSHKVPPMRPKGSRITAVMSSEETANLNTIYSEWAEAIKMGRFPRTIDADLGVGKGCVKMQLNSPKGYYSLEGDEIIDHAHGLIKALEQRSLKCIWVEMADSPTPESMLHDILTTISLSRGYFQLQHAELLPNKFPQHKMSHDLFARYKRVMTVLGTEPQTWVILLYGRTVPGASAGWDGDCWNGSDYNVLHQMFAQLGIGKDETGNQIGLGMRIVYMPFTQNRYKAQRVLATTVLNAICNRHKINLTHNGTKKTGMGLHYASAWKNIANKLSSVAKLSPVGKLSVAATDYVKFHKRNYLSIPTRSHVDHNFKVKPAIETPHESDDLLDYVIAEWLVTSEDQITTKKDQWVKLHFLYGLLLFRQSRHPNAILTDAVYRCPKRFNLDRVDNDWLRDEQTNLWMRELSQSKERYRNIFLQKPGGYAWIYREDRISLLCLIESEFNWKVDTEKHFDFPGQIRGRMHNWIADWYFKAFCATGHITPLFESFYHRYLSMRYIWFDKRGLQSLDRMRSMAIIASNRVLGYHEALNCLLKAFRIARPWINFWLSESAAIGRVNLPKGKLPPFDMRSLSGCGIIVNAKLLPTIRRRISSMQTAVELAFAELVETAGSERRILSVPRPADATGDNIKDAIVEAYSLEITAVQRDNFQDEILSLLKKHHYTCFTRLFGTDVEDVKSIAKSRRVWLLRHLCQQQRLFVVTQLLSEFAYLHVKRAKLECHAGDRDLLSKQRVAMRWVEVCMICHETIKLCPHLDASILTAEILLRTKVATFYGLALGQLGRFFEAHRRLNEAEALLSKNNVAIDPLELAKIKLRRAEVCLLESEAAGNLASKHGQKNRENEGLTDKLIRFGERNVSSGDYAVDAARLRAAKIDDAWILLEASRQLLSGKSHSSLWWGRWYALALRAYGATNGCLSDTLPFRRVIDQEAYVWQVFEESGLISDSDSYRQLRFIDYCHLAFVAIAVRLGNDYWIQESNHEKLMERLKRIKREAPILQSDEESLLGKYWSKVHRRVVGRRIKQSA